MLTPTPTTPPKRRRKGGREPVTVLLPPALAVALRMEKLLSRQQLSEIVAEALTLHLPERRKAREIAIAQESLAG